MKTPLLLLMLSLMILGAGLSTKRGNAGEPSRMPIFAPVKLIKGDEQHRKEAQLGRALFFDRRLSQSAKTSCASCHDLDTNGATGTTIDRGDAGQPMAHNTPTLFNAVYDFRFGWSGEHQTMREQVQIALKNTLNCAASLTSKRLAADPAMLARFRAVYDDAPKENHIVDALTAFMDTLVTPDAPFDRWLEGDRAALSEQQQRGFARFKSLGCVNCHQGRNLGANLIERRGLFRPLGNPNPRYMRVPSLRNVAVTAPYFHDGSGPTLPVVIRMMARAQLDLEISDKDVQDIVAFLQSLTGTYQGRPLRPARDAHK